MRIVQGSKGFWLTGAMKRPPSIVIDRERCKGCELCIPVCPRHVLAMGRAINRQGLHYAAAVKPEACTGCLNCARLCPDGAIEILP